MADTRSSGKGEKGEKETREPSSASSDQANARARPKALWQGVESFIKALPLSEVGDALSRSSRVGRLRLDIFLLRREREQLLKDLGAQVLDEAKANRLVLPAAAQAVVGQLLGVEERLAEELQNLGQAQGKVSESERWEEELWARLREEAEEVVPDPSPNASVEVEGPEQEERAENFDSSAKPEK